MYFPLFSLKVSHYKLIFTRTVLKELKFCSVIRGMSGLGHSIIDSDVGHDSSALEMLDSVVAFSSFRGLGIDVVVLLVF